jgi:exonuclease SbcD
MMKAFHIADTHIKLGARWDECRRVLEHFAGRVEDEKPDVIIHAGDVFDARSTPKEMEYAEQWFQRLADTSPVVVVGGNHDDYTELRGLRRLSSKHLIQVITTPSAMHFAGLHLRCIPWPTLSSVVAESNDLDSANMTAADHLRSIFNRIGNSPAAGFPCLGVMHAMVTGSKTAAGQPLRNCDFTQSMEDLAWLRCDGIALGHIHNEQQWLVGPSGKPCVVRYCGSPFHTDWGDWVTKSYTIWEYDSRGILHVEAEPLPAHQMIDVPMEFVPSEWNLRITDPAKSQVGDYDDFRDQELRLSYSFSPEHASGAHNEAKNWERQLRQFGAADVKLNPNVIVTTAARIPEVATSTTPEDKLKAYMRSRGEDPDTADNQRVLAKFATLQGNNETTED